MTAGEIQQVLSTWQAVSESEVRLPNLQALVPQAQPHLPPKPAKLA